MNLFKKLRNAAENATKTNIDLFLELKRSPKFNPEWSFRRANERKSGIKSVFSFSHLLAGVFVLHEFRNNLDDFSKSFDSLVVGVKQLIAGTPTDYFTASNIITIGVGAAAVYVAGKHLYDFTREQHQGRLQDFADSDPDGKLLLARSWIRGARDLVMLGINDLMDGIAHTIWHEKTENNGHFMPFQNVSQNLASQDQQ